MTWQWTVLIVEVRQLYGVDIPLKLLRLYGDKVPYIDLNSSGEYQDMPTFPVEKF